jgi:nicotinamide-nucleotide amidase
VKRAEQILVNYLKKNNLTIAFAESMTCGLISHKLGTISGTSDIFSGSIVCYNEKVKTGLLRVNKKLIAKHTAESQIVTDGLAKNLQKVISADVHAAITGLASPGGSETKLKPVGTIFYSCLFKGKLSHMKKKFNGSPLQIKEKASKQFFKFLLAELRKSGYS